MKKRALAFLLGLTMLLVLLVPGTLADTDAGQTPETPVETPAQTETPTQPETPT